MPMHKEGENPTGEMVPNYSKVPAINRFYNSRETIFSGGGLTDADVAKVEALIRGGISSETICAAFDSEQSRWPRDSVNQSRAIKAALDRMGLSPGTPGPTQEEMHKKMGKGE